MDRARKKPFLKQHKLAFQSAALVLMLAVPVALYHLAQAGSHSGMLAGLAVLGLAMALAALVS